MKVAVIGGGAAGFFAAISCKQHHPEAQVVILEKSNKTLAKVKVSGGGRCNVTHNCFELKKLLTNYPRGGKFLRKPFQQFDCQSTINWFEDKGIALKTEADGRMFPESNTSSTIISILHDTCRRLKVEVRKAHGVNNIRSIKEGFTLDFLQDAESETFDKVIITAGGFPKSSSYDWIKVLGIKIIEPVPSLFTFNVKDRPLNNLMGLSSDVVGVKILGEKLESSGPGLITHWGFSGPAVLKLSAFGARLLHDKDYEFKIRLNWLNRPEDTIREDILSNQHSKQLVKNYLAEQLPKRLVAYLLNKVEVSGEKPLNELPKKERNRIINVLSNDQYQVKGKSTFKEEFVTAGGVALSGVSPETMQSKVVPGLYFAGEVLDIDALTGGFNFQAAWSTGHLAGQLKG